MASIDERLVDKRIVERNLEKGLLSTEQRKAYLDALPDRAGIAEVIQLHDPSADAGEAEPNEDD